MRFAAGLTLWLIMAGLSTQVSAAQRATLENSGCDRALEEYYGDEASFRLVNRRNTREGLMIKVAVRPVAASEGKWESHYSTCLVKRDSGKIEIEETPRAGSGTR